MFLNSDVSNVHTKSVSSDSLIHTLSVSSSHQHDIPIQSHNSFGLRFNSTPKMIDSFSSLNNTRIQPILEETPCKRRKVYSEYADLVLLESGPEPLISYFISENKYTRLSDALGLDFSLSSCLSRLKSPQTVIYLNYNRPEMKETTLEVLPSGLKFKGKRVIPYRDFKGLFFGGSSTYNKFGSFFKGLYSDKCISLVRPDRTIDFYAASQTKKYDLMIALSWYISVSISSRFTRETGRPANSFVCCRHPFGNLTARHWGSSGSARLVGALLGLPAHLACG